jgi:argininosuccinate lyase
VAALLGFDGVVDNSADAVASRDWAVRVLSALALIGVALTRLATDMQTWSSAAYGFLDWPDELVSTSSIMPQKRNAYVWENVRGQAASSIGALAGTLAGLKNVPFANSIEGGSEALGPLWPTLHAQRAALRLTRLLVRTLRVDRERLLAFLEHSDATLTALADMLVLRHGLAFREAHDAVGQFLRARLPGPDEPWRGLRRAVRQVTGREVELDRDALARTLDPRSCLESATHGGGPAPDAVRAQLAALEPNLLRLKRGQEARREALAHAEARLRAALDRLHGGREAPPAE